ncbi:PPP4R2-domain-containing protein [Mortierella sp. GBAus27b]|nr:PPP4R2-domain-containing protein [Mortierella sp. GBAus27b]
MTEQDHAATASDRNALIHQIALTNQVDVPWDELKAVLKQRLDEVLESKVLTYTEPTVTNPLTIQLTSLPLDGAAADSGPSSSAASSKDRNPVDPREQTDDLDQAHVPDQISEPNNQDPAQQDNTNSSNNGKSDPEQTVQDAESTQTPSPESNTDGQQSESQVLPEQVPAEHATTSNGERSEINDPAQSEAAAVATQASSESGSQMVPVSRDTLVLETPEGYHQRINGLLSLFTSPPFTIQRVCELLLNPTEHHSNLIKYLRAVEKVLMITSSINEFSNPAYNGPSALDEDSTTGNKRDGATVNGDYARAKILDFDLITETSTTADLADTNTHEAPTEVVNDQGDVPRENSVADATEHQSAKDTGKIDRTMEIGEPASADMDVDVAVGAAMDGVETEEGSKSRDEQSKSNNIQVESETDAGMDVDQV